MPDGDVAHLEPCRWSDLSGWPGDDHAAVWAALRRSVERGRLSAKSLTPSGLEPALHRALSASPGREALERLFRPARVRGGPDHLTGYYEPVVRASRDRSERFAVPLHRRPPEVVRASPEEERRTGMTFGVRRRDGFRPFHDRAAVMDGALDGRGLEIAFVESPVDAFFIHVQGSARLETDEGTIRVAFDGKSGHPYVSLGKLLAQKLHVSRETMTADRLAAWMRENEREADALLRRNPSYIYFRETEHTDDGPVAAAGVALSAGRSLAVDRKEHAFGTLLWIEPGGNVKPRLAVAQDTGSAIRGPARGDLFVGTGPDAGLEAGRINERCAFFALVPRDNARRA